MSDFASSIGNFFSGTGGKDLTALLGLGGAASNLYSGFENFQNQQNYNDQIKKAQAILSDPKKLQAAVAAIQQPLSAGLTEGVGNAVQGSMAERGLATSPALMQSVMAQAIAPYVQQNQQTALNAVLQKLGLVEQSRPALFPQTNLTSLLKLISSGGGTPGVDQSGLDAAWGPGTTGADISAWFGGPGEVPYIPVDTGDGGV